LTNLTFIFSDGTSSPPSGTYKSKCEKRTKLTQLKAMNIGSLTFSIHILKHSGPKDVVLRGLNLKDRYGLIMGKAVQGQYKEDFQIDFNMSAMEHIVGSQIAVRQDDTLRV